MYVVQTKPVRTDTSKKRTGDSVVRILNVHTGNLCTDMCTFICKLDVVVFFSWNWIAFVRYYFNRVKELHGKE
jgi:hypothetical protein